MQVATMEAQALFRFLRPEQVAAISDAAEPTSSRAGDIVYRQGSKARYSYIVVSGKVALLQQEGAGLGVIVDELGEGELFGTCVCLDLDTYTVTAQCTEDAELLRIEAPVLKKLMDEDLRMGYALQTQISKLYFKRYIESMTRSRATATHILPGQS
jgi:CRP-like cAMP-binding protein